MKNFILFTVLLIASVSVLLLIRYNKENADVTRILEKERYDRMSAEEELQKGEYRIKKLEADLQTTQVKLSKMQEILDKQKEENGGLKSQIDQLDRAKNTLEKDLKTVAEERAALEEMKKVAEARIALAEAQAKEEAEEKARLDAAAAQAGAVK